ncbi:uncharacterized protein [Lepeophtheirus salmonis]|uniref:Actin interacting protein 3-like C-terminal domain-containing protein n=1 Tax=Lepeophtheirus salmonis TaxID=72036 RepID=A0A0K2U0X1_LEPSM|nr:coiled-coil domain-containing protein AGAP005037-like [Lepeophtheirus salmonis]
MPLNLIRSKKKDGFKKVSAFVKKENHESKSLVINKKENGSLGNPTSPSNEIINLTSETNNIIVGGTIMNTRSKAPRLGLGGISSSLFDEDSGIMSEVETSSTGILPSNHGNRRSAKFKTSLVGLGPIYSGAPSSMMTSMDDDPGIMSEAETSSTVRMKRSNRGRNSIPMGSLTLQRSGSSLLSKPATVSFLHQNGPSPYYEFQDRSFVPQQAGMGMMMMKGSNLFEDDPGIMSEAETSSTGGGGRRNRHHHHHSNKKSTTHSKSTLPVVRTPSKTLERPLGLVFLIYRGETKRALLPNEITSKDTVKALFVRSFGKSLTMEYMDSPRVKIYIHDSAKDIFYELENLGEIKDRSIIKLFEADSSGRGPCGLGPGGLPPITNKDEVQDHGPIHSNDYVPLEGSFNKSGVKMGNFPSQISGNGVVGEVGRSTTLPRNAFSALGIPPPNASTEFTQNKPIITTRVSSSGLGAPVGILRPESALGERSKTLGPGFMRGYERNNFVSSPDGNFGISDQIPRSRFSTIPEGRYYSGPGSTEEAKARMMHMEAQLSQLTGMVEKALKNKKASGGTKKTVSFEKSVTFSDDPPPSILSTSKRPTQTSVMPMNTLHSQLGILQKSTRELRQEVRVLRRLTQLQSMAMKDLVQDTYLKLKEACIVFSGSVLVGSDSGSSEDTEERLRITQDDEVFSNELNALLTHLSTLEVRVEEMRSGVIAKKNKISLQDVENMAISLSKNSKAVTQLKMAYPSLESRFGKEGLLQKKIPERIDNAWRRCKKLTGTLVTLKRLASVQEQRFNPGAVQMDVTSLSPTPLEMSRYGSLSSTSAGSVPSSSLSSNDTSNSSLKEQDINSKDSSLDDLLDALQSYSKDPSSSTSSGTSQVSIALKPTPVSNLNTSKLTPVPAAVKTNALSNEEIADLSPMKKPSNSNNTSATSSKKVNTPGAPHRNTKGAPPPPPPRTSSTLRQPLGRAVSTDSTCTYSSSSSSLRSGETSSSSESINSQEGASNIMMLRKANSVTGPPVPLKPIDLKSLTTKSRQDALETRHQELLTRQRQLQEQYQRLQLMQENNKNKQQILLHQTIKQPTSPLPEKEADKSEKDTPDVSSAQGTLNKSPSVADNSVKDQIKAINNKEKGKGAPPPLPVRSNSILTERKEYFHQQQQQVASNEKNDEQAMKKESNSVVKEGIDACNSTENNSTTSTKIYETDII